MRILLVNPPNSGRSIPEEQYGITGIKMIFRGEPLALEALAGNLDAHETDIVDLKAEPDVLWEVYDRFRPDLTGITGVTCEADAVKDMARKLKKKGCRWVVVGGHHASCDPACFNDPSVDYVVIGLGKASFRELADALERHKPTDGIPGVARIRRGKPMDYVPRRYTEEDLADDKAPRYDLVAKNRDRYVMSGVGGRMGFVAHAFGCTHRCAFCSIPSMTGGRYLSHSVDAVVRDMTTLKDLPVIRLVDANTFGNPKDAEALARRIIDAGLRQNIVADVRSDTVVRHPELFRLWKQAGLATAVIGFEECRDDRLERYHKKNTVAVHVEALGILKDIGVRVIGDFIVSPDYGYEDFEALERFVSAHPIDLPLPAILTPIPGTPLYEELKDRIRVRDLAYYTFLNAVTPTRLPEKTFYETYSALLQRCIGHLRH